MLQEQKEAPRRCIPCFCCWAFQAKGYSVFNFYYSLRQRFRGPVRQACFQEFHHYRPHLLRLRFTQSGNDGHKHVLAGDIRDEIVTASDRILPDHPVHSRSSQQKVRHDLIAKLSHVLLQAFSHRRYRLACLA